MFDNSVVVMDIRSFDISAAVVERGVNNTFVMKNRITREYDGYSEKTFIDKDNFNQTIAKTVSDISSSLDRPVKKIYVSVPGEFLTVVNTDKTISFSSRRPVREKDLRYIEDLSMPVGMANYMCLYSSCIYYVLSDKRRMVNPVGEMTDSLQARLCFYLVENYFVEALRDAFDFTGQNMEVDLIPSVHAQAMYLVPPENRSECTVIFDLGSLSSTYTVVYGNGVLSSDSFSVGMEHIVFYLSEELDIPYGAAGAFLRNANLNARDTGGRDEIKYRDNRYEILSSGLRDCIREGIDGICEVIEDCADVSGINTAGKPLYIYGEGVPMLRGICEHISSRLERVVKPLVPKVPYYDKPQYSSLLSLMNAALETDERASKIPKFLRKRK